MSRKPVRDLYDAIVGLEPKRKGEIPTYAYALFKITFEIGPIKTSPTTAEPLLYDIYNDDTLQPKIPPGSDFWVWKQATDVVIHGSAYTPNGKPSRSHTVAASIGNVTKKISVFGRREIVKSSSGSLAASDIEPFTEMPLVYSNAYGGLDPRVQVPEPERQGFARLLELGLAFDHPGGYPRNPAGKGYMVYPELIRGLEMPNLEDPSDLLTPQRLVTGDPRLWYKQPLPWCFEWTNILQYPRELCSGYDAWYPCPPNVACKEAQRGYIPANLAKTVQETRRVHPDFYQEASLGMTFRSPLVGQPVILSGMHPDEPVIRFSVPPDPLIEIDVEGNKSAVKPQITNLVMQPKDRKFSVVYCAKAPLPRAFIPEVHKDIPVLASINHDLPIRYEAPVPVRERLQAAQASNANRT